MFGGKVITYELFDVHDNSYKCHFLLFYSLRYEVVLEEMSIVYIRTHIPHFLLLPSESDLRLACCSRQQMVRYLPSEEFAESPQSRNLFFVAPFGQNALAFLLNLLG